MKNALGYLFHEVKPHLQILKNVKNLYIPEEFHDFERALLALHDLDLLASNPVVPETYKDTIKKWRDAWHSLFLKRGLTYPNKIHILNHHLEVSISYILITSTHLFIAFII